MRNVLEYLEKTALDYPQKLAVKDDDSSMNYMELQERAKQIGSMLCGVESPRQPIVVFMEKSVEALATFLGITYAGCFYVLLDPTFPKQRLEQVLSVLQPKVLITTQKYQEKLSELNYENRVILYSEITKTTDEEALKQVRMQAVDTDPLYCNFTSGSTGVPKGVLVCHRSVIDFIDVFADIFGFTSEDVFGNQAPFDFDVSVKDIYSCLKTGASLIIIPKSCFMFPTQVMDRLEDNRVTVLVWAVSALCMINRLHGFKYKVPAYIKQVMFSGEKMPIKQLNQWMGHYPETRFVNLYGPTEITCNCTYHIVERTYEEGENLPIGKAFPNEKVFLLDEGKQVTKPGEVGELCVSGTPLALGYFRNPEMTAKMFCQNPLNPDYPETIYRTGDLAHYGEDGNLYFCGRCDFQIKHMGHRIELEEVEGNLNATDGIDQACCFFDETKNKMVACYVGSGEKRAIIEDMKTKVPDFMIPNVFIQLEDLPLSANGKVDRKGMKAKYQQGELNGK